RWSPDPAGTGGVDVIPPVRALAAPDDIAHYDPPIPDGALASIMLGSPARAAQDRQPSAGRPRRPASNPSLGTGLKASSRLGDCPTIDYLRLAIITIGGQVV